MSVQIDSTIIGALNGTKIVSGIRVPNSGWGVLLDNGIIIDVKGNRVLSDVESAEVVLVATRRLRREAAELTGLVALTANLTDKPAPPERPVSDEEDVLPFMPEDAPIESDIASIVDSPQHIAEQVALNNAARKLMEAVGPLGLAGNVSGNVSEPGPEVEPAPESKDEHPFMPGYQPTGELAERSKPVSGAQFADIGNSWPFRTEKEEGRD